MKRFAALVAVLAVMAMPLTATAGENCSASKAKNVSNSSCGSKATTASTASTASNTSCASEATTASNTSCASKATTASNTSCSSGAAKTASNALCASTAKASVYCGTGASCGDATASVGDCCKSTNVIYKVSADGKDMETFAFADAKAMADKHDAKVQFVAAGNTFETENDARMALTKAIYDRIGELTVVAYNVNGETTHCSMTASAKAASCKDGKVKYQVANRTFETQEAADTFLTKVKSAMDNIKLVDAHGNVVEGCAVSHCSKTVESAKSAKPTTTTFVVAGKTVADPFEANLVAAQERLRVVLNTDA